MALLLLDNIYKNIVIIYFLNLPYVSFISSRDNAVLIFFKEQSPEPNETSKEYDPASVIINKR